MHSYLSLSVLLSYWTNKRVIITQTVTLVVCVGSVVTARVGGGSKEAGGGTNVTARHCCRHKEPEHCTNNP